MKTGELIGEIVKFEEGSKDIYVEIITRDGNGNVTDKKIYPVSCTFGHHVNKVTLKCEESEKEV